MYKLIAENGIENLFCSYWELRIVTAPGFIFEAVMLPLFYVHVVVVVVEACQL